MTSDPPAHEGPRRGRPSRRLLLILLSGILVGVAVFVFIVTLRPAASPLIVKASPAVSVQWPDSRGTVGVSLAFPPKLLVNQSYILGAHVTFFVFGPGLSPPVLDSPDRDFFISAHMVGTAFDIKPTTPDSQPAKGGLMGWGWMVLPKYAGRHTLLVTMDVEHRAKQTGQLLKTTPLWSTGPRLLEVDEPWLKRGQVDLLSIVVGFFSGLVTSLVTGKLFPKSKEGF